jgi:uncharacterized SAM-binding protein YcdF (DUF218 family)
MAGTAVIADVIRGDVELLWSYHDLGHAPRRTDVGIGLGSHDPSVSIVTTDFYHRGLFPLIVFTGATVATTVARFPRGEAVHYREYALANGVPPAAVLLEPQARNTGENISLTRKLLADHGVEVRSVTLLSRPYQQRRAYATCQRLWPEVDVVCASHPLALDEYVASIGDADRVVNMLVGDTQRVERYAEAGFAIPQPMPADVRAAYRRLAAAGYTARLV